MIKKKVLILGSTGQIGRHLIRKLTKNNYKAICQTRNSHKAIYLKTSGSIGYIDIVETSIFDKQKLEHLIENSDICINLIGILYEKGKINTFKRIHTELPDTLSKICSDKNKSFIHLSALGIENAKNSIYAQSKLEGEAKIRANHPQTIIIKPSIVFSVSDSLTTKFMSILNILPIFPLYYKGNTKFMPIHASEVADLLYYIIDKGITSKSIEAVGPEVLTFKKILQVLLNCINKNKLLLSIPLPLAKLSAAFFQIMPKPLITLDQLKLLKYDNIKSGKYETNFDIGCPSKITLKEGVNKYAYNWMDGGQYSLKKNKK